MTMTCMHDDCCICCTMHGNAMHAAWWLLYIIRSMLYDAWPPSLHLLLYFPHKYGGRHGTSSLSSLTRGGSKEGKSSFSCVVSDRGQRHTHVYSRLEHTNQQQAVPAHKKDSTWTVDSQKSLAKGNNSPTRVLRITRGQSVTRWRHSLYSLVLLYGSIHSKQ